MGSTNVIFLRVFVTPNGPRETSCVQCESPLGGHSLTMLTKFFPLLTTPVDIAQVKKFLYVLGKICISLTLPPT